MESHGFPGGSDSKESACNAGDLGSIPGLGKSPGEGHGNPLQYSCLENSTDRGAWRATVHATAKSLTQLSVISWNLMLWFNLSLFLWPCAHYYYEYLHTSTPSWVLSVTFRTSSLSLASNKLRINLLPPLCEVWAKRSFLKLSLLIWLCCLKLIYDVAQLTYLFTSGLTCKIAREY